LCSCSLVFAIDFLGLSMLVELGQNGRQCRCSSRYGVEFINTYCHSAPASATPSEGPSSWRLCRCRPLAHFLFLVSSRQSRHWTATSPQSRSLPGFLGPSGPKTTRIQNPRSLNPSLLSYRPRLACVFFASVLEPQDAGRFSTRLPNPNPWLTF
jgi:hypothetical protein